MQTPRIFLRIGMIVGALLMGAALIGAAGAMSGVAQAFGTLGQSGIGDPRGLSSAVAEVLLGSAGSLVLFPCGLVLLIVCLVMRARLRRAGPPPVPRYPDDSANS